MLIGLPGVHASIYCLSPGSAVASLLFLLPFTPYHNLLGCREQYTVSHLAIFPAKRLCRVISSPRKVLHLVTTGSSVFETCLLSLFKAIQP